MGDEWIEGRGYRKKVLFTEDDLGTRGVRIQMVEIGGNSRVEPHYHKKQTEVYNVQSGSAILGIDGTGHQVDEGDTLICKPGQVHYVINGSPDTFRLLLVKTNYEDKDTFWEDG